MSSLHLIDRPDPLAVPADAVAWLRELDGPTAIRVPGRDPSRLRIAVTLLHGNEPSGLRAVQAWLRSDAVPATDTLLVLGAIDAALAEPVLTTRQLPGAPDLNRVFAFPDQATKHGRFAQALLELIADPRTEAKHGRFAQALLELIADPRTEALIDLHNNSGRNPAYGVIQRADPAESVLVGLFADTAVVYGLRLGALIELTADQLPSAVIECGLAGDPAADAVAHHGLQRFLGEDDLLDRLPPPLRVLGDPVRVEVAAGVTVAFDAEAVDGRAREGSAQLLLDSAIDRLNFAAVSAGTVLGSVAAGAPWPLVARGADGRDRSRELFAVEGSRLVTLCELTPIMMTTSPAIAHSDCVFYATSPRAKLST